jgi:hypothetical protein
MLAKKQNGTVCLSIIALITERIFLVVSGHISWSFLSTTMNNGNTVVIILNSSHKRGVFGNNDKDSS